MVGLGIGPAVGPAPHDADGRRGREAIARVDNPVVDPPHLKHAQIACTVSSEERIGGDDWNFHHVRQNMIHPETRLLQEAKFKLECPCQ